MWRLVLLFFISLTLSCKEEIISDASSLASFLADTRLSIQDSSVIACAAGISDSVNVYYYPAPGFSDYRIWMLDDPSGDSSDFSFYSEVEYPVGQLFNGYLEYFLLEDFQSETWITVTGESNTQLVVAQPIRIKQKSFPTEVNPELLTIDQSERLMPCFSWKDGSHPGTVIYFHVVSDSQSDLLSGTYTFERQWQFYDLSNVVLNIRDVTPPPELIQQSIYGFSLMGVSEDNWVNMFIQTNFTTN